MGKKLKIAMIGHKRIPSKAGGVEVVVGELSSCLSHAGHQVCAYNRSTDGEWRRKEQPLKGKESIRLIEIPTMKNGFGVFWYAFLATFHALFSHYDVIHYHAEGTALLCWLPKLFGIRTVVTVHGLDWQRSKWGRLASKMIKLGEITAVHCADEMIVLSKNMSEYFQTEYGRTTTYIPNGIPVFREGTDDNILKKHGLETDDYFLYVGRIVSEKGLHYLLEAFANISTDKKLVICGSNGGGHEYYEKIMQMAAKDARVKMVGFIEGKELETFYKNAYVFVLPSDLEGMSISLLEARGYGCCCLVSDILENTEVTGESAAIFRRGDVLDLQLSMEKLIHSEETVEQYRKLTREQNHRHGISWEEMTERTLRCYQNQPQSGEEK